MKWNTLAVALAVGLDGALAHPAISHASLHKLHLRDVTSKRDSPDTSNVNWSEALKGKDWSTVDWSKVFGKGAKAPAPSSGSGSPAKPKTEVKAQVPASSDDTPKEDSTPVKGSGKCLNTAGNSKRATVQQDNYVGNHIGNIVGTSDCKADGSYSLTIVNNRGSTKNYWVWNKISPDGQMNGMMTTPAHTISLENGQQATFSIQPNSQVGFSEDCGRAANNGGVPNCPVGEANFNDQNAQGGAVGGSFYDVSMVTYNQIKQEGGSPNMVPITISAPGYDDSTNTNCVYNQPADNSPVNPGSSGKCACGPNDASPFHITATFG